jgi:hypothetical protein
MTQYVKDYWSRNVKLAELFRGALYVEFGRPLDRRFGFARHLYDSFQAVAGGLAIPMKRGTVPSGRRTPVAFLDLKSRELVRINHMRRYSRQRASSDSLTRRWDASSC